MRGKVQIMTLHKSKGDEFEYVFLPEMAEKNLSIDVDKAKTKASTIFMEEVRAFNPSYKSKSELELREFNSAVCSDNTCTVETLYHNFRKSKGLGQ